MYALAWLLPSEFNRFSKWYEDLTPFHMYYSGSAYDPTGRRIPLTLTTLIPVLFKMLHIDTFKILFHPNWTCKMD